MNIILGILTDAFFIALLVWCAYTGIRRRTVSNVSVTLLLCLGFTHMVLLIISGSTWWAYPAGLALCIPFYIAWLKNVMGAGDVKLLMGISLYLGLLNTIIAFMLMVPVMTILIVRSCVQKKSLEQRIPFAPVLAFGAIGATAAGYLYAIAYV